MDLNESLIRPGQINEKEKDFRWHTGNAVLKMCVREEEVQN